MGPESAGYAAPVSQRRVARVSPATGRRTCQSHSVLERGTEGGALLRTCAHVPVDKDCGNVPAVVWMRSGRVLLAVVDVQGPENTATIHTPVLFLTRPPQPVARPPTPSGPGGGSPGSFPALLSLPFSCLGGARSEETGSCTEVGHPLRSWACSLEHPGALRLPVCAFCMSS